jgi:hypothetical protein
MTVPAWSPIKAWQSAIKCPFNRERNKAAAALRAVERRFPTPKPWKPKAATAQDRRMARQYDAEATPMFRECVIIKLRTDIDSLRRALWRDKSGYHKYRGSRWHASSLQVAIRDLRRILGRRLKPIHLPVLDYEDETRWTRELEAMRAA